MLSVRPKVAELAFQVYGRSLHPELFDIFETRSIERGEYKATIGITRDGKSYSVFRISHVFPTTYSNAFPVHAIIKISYNLMIRIGVNGKGDRKKAKICGSYFLSFGTYIVWSVDFYRLETMSFGPL